MYCAMGGGTHTAILFRPFRTWVQLPPPHSANRASVTAHSVVVRNNLLGIECKTMCSGQSAHKTTRSHPIKCGCPVESERTSATTMQLLPTAGRKKQRIAVWSCKQVAILAVERCPFPSTFVVQLLALFQRGQAPFFAPLLICYVVNYIKGDATVIVVIVGSPIVCVFCGNLTPSVVVAVVLGIVCPNVGFSPERAGWEAEVNKWMILRRATQCCKHQRKKCGYKMDCFHNK